MTPQDLNSLKVIDEIIQEPLGGAHRNQKEVAESLADTLKGHLDELTKKPYDTLLDERYNKFRLIGGLQENS
jgi:acetyl-CoA carboxylase carboxyl transferase subunit alpha